jgi:hypothetical protein
LKNLKISDAKIKHAIHAYTVEEKSLVDVSKILGLENKQSTARFLKNMMLKLDRQIFNDLYILIKTQT